MAFKASQGPVPAYLSRFFSYHPPHCLPPSSHSSPPDPTAKVSASGYFLSLLPGIPIPISSQRISSHSGLSFNYPSQRSLITWWFFITFPCFISFIAVFIWNYLYTLCACKSMLKLKDMNPQYLGQYQTLSRCAIKFYKWKNDHAWAPESLSQESYSQERKTVWLSLVSYHPPQTN